VFGVLHYRSGDYVVIPRATTHRWVPNQSSRLYAIEANSHIAPPKRYLSRYGQLLEHAPYCERDLHGPVGPLVPAGSTGDLETDVEVLVKHRTSAGVVGTRMTYATHPFDVVGWDGCLYPYTFNIDDYMPITGKIHQPPPVHQVFEGHNFVICNFLPRKVDYHPLSVPVPYYHSNVDSDEVMFYVGGDYEARKGSGINIGSVSLHPGGHAHGPQPAAIEASLGAEYFDESAVMVDTFAPLDLGEAGVAAEDPAYAWSWAGRGPEGGDSPAVFSNS
ncbi:MAG TPA: homogentisate 1,2-dioxygenase domain-containing protein, partial [Nocardioides sp.]|nr:homogentisate 1,2-dioxygenase domain-containing protein [Nocardioides sp.]